MKKLTAKEIKKTVKKHFSQIDKNMKNYESHKESFDFFNNCVPDEIIETVYTFVEKSYKEDMRQSEIRKKMNSIQLATIYSIIDLAMFRD